MNFFVFVVFLVASSTHQAAGENNTAAESTVQNLQWDVSSDSNCVCYDKGKIVNPSPLRFTNGTPRFVKYAKHLHI